MTPGRTAAQLRAGLKNGDATATVTLAAELRGAARSHPLPAEPVRDGLEKVAERWQKDWTNGEKQARKTIVRYDRCFGYLIHERGPRTPIGPVESLARTAPGSQRPHNRPPRLPTGAATLRRGGRP